MAKRKYKSKSSFDFEKYKYYILGGAGLLVLIAVLLLVFWAPSTEGTTAQFVKPGMSEQLAGRSRTTPQTAVRTPAGIATPSIILTASEVATSSDDNKLTSNITAQTSNNRAGVSVLFFPPPSIGNLYDSSGRLRLSCTTDSSGRCSLLLKSWATGTSAITASARGYNRGTTTVVLAYPSLNIISTSPSSLSSGNATGVVTVTVQASDNRESVRIELTCPNESNPTYDPCYNSQAGSQVSCYTQSNGQCSINIRLPTAAPTIYGIVALAQNYNSAYTRVAVT